MHGRRGPLYSERWWCSMVHQPRQLVWMIIYFVSSQHADIFSWSSFRSVRNLIIDLRQIPSGTSAIGLHWQVSQATSLVNVVVEMTTASGNQQSGEYNSRNVRHYIADLSDRSIHGGRKVSTHCKKSKDEQYLIFLPTVVGSWEVCSHHQLVNNFETNISG